MKDEERRDRIAWEIAERLLRDASYPTQKAAAEWIATVLHVEELRQNLEAVRQKLADQGKADERE